MEGIHIMRKIFRKNQIIITSLAALIAVAGYLNHIESSEKDLSAVSDNVENESATETEKENNIKEEAKGEEQGTAVSSGDVKDIDSNDIDMSGEPGEAVFVNAVGTVDFIVEAKLLREQTRASSKTMLMEVVNSTNVTDEEKKAAVDKIAELADIADREMAAENLISARGYENVVVTITDDAADVMLVSDTLTDTKRAQIEEIVKGKTKVSADKITITAVKTN